MWDLASGAELMTLTAHEGKVNAVAIVANGKYVYSVSDDFTLKAWDLASGRLLASYTGDSPMQACSTGVGGMVVAGDQAGRLHFLSLECADRP